MKARLIHPDRDFDWQWVLQALDAREAARTGWRRYRSDNFDPHRGLPWNEAELTADLGLNAVFEAMADGDDCVFEASRKVLLAGVRGSLDTIRYRQQILGDCLNNSGLVRDLYAIAMEATAMQKGSYLGSLAQHPDWVLRHSIEVLEGLLSFLRKLRKIADANGEAFVSEGWTRFFTMVKAELGDEYFASLERYLEELKFRKGRVLLSAELGAGNKASRYVLHRSPLRTGRWKARLQALLGRSPPLSFELHPRDEAGAQSLAAIRNRGLSSVATALGQSADHVRSFFAMLRVELAFYVGCLNLYEKLSRKNEPICMPLAAAANEQRLSFLGLYDVGLSLSIGEPVVGNDADADDKGLVMVTGANTGGKSTFLRSVGLAQLMMQSGMFVPAQSFCSSLCDGLFSHYKREEDAAMESGKFDEELHRMSNIVDHLASHSLVLLNESFATTNEREGSEIARQVILALREKQVRVVCVTHLYELANGFWEGNREDTLFLRAGRQADGTRTFKLVAGEPLPTSFGQDLYRSIFTAKTDQPEPSVAIGDGQ